MKQHVILVHGTFAYDKNDHGNGWWQNGHDFVTELKQKYHVSLIDQAKLFKWTGENKFSHRLIFANELFQHLKKLEENNIPYHLVGHSHGGSLIHHALQISCFTHSLNRFFFKKVNPKLENLKSWTTVGTPFIVDQPPEKYGQKLAYQLAKLLFLLGVATYLLMPYMPRISGETSNFTPLNLFILSGSFIIFLSFVLSPVIINVNELMKLALLKRANSFVDKYYADKWLGITSKNDEAILLLQAINNLSANDLEFSNSSQFKDAEFSDISKPILQIAKEFLFNIFIAPFIKRGFLGYIRIKILGNDNPVVKSIRIEKYPSKTNNSGFLNLPNHVEDQLANDADREISNNMIEIRKFLFEASKGNPLNSFIKNNKFSGKELIHTSYFENSYITREIIDHIEMQSY